MSRTPMLKIDDFWKDCISDPYTKPKLKKINNANKKNKTKNMKAKTYFNENSNYVYNRKIKLITDTDIDIKNSQTHIKQINKNNRRLIKEALIKENLMPLIENKKKEKVIQKYVDIYNKDKTYQDLKLKNNEKQKKKIEKSKAQECTFKPVKCVNKKIEKKINKRYIGTNIYERNIIYKQKHNEKVAFLLNEISKVNNNYKSSQCFFQPTILNTNVEKILYDQNNIWKEQADNDSNKLFLLRYIKARDEEFNKKERLNNSVNRKLKKSLNKQKKMNRSISQKDSLILQKNLHNILYSLGNLLEDEEDEEANNYKEEEQKLELNNIINKSGNNLQWTFAKKFD